MKTSPIDNKCLKKPKANEQHQVSISTVNTRLDGEDDRKLTQDIFQSENEQLGPSLSTAVTSLTKMRHYLP